ncbi:MAG: SWIM zinc finger family protein [Micrococcales bacterium]|nr:SWIM zinc finger family protein [Micrococcales bacterium]MCL2667817.1 SWIM zinc finger family protein [Micrococcales bacterium]
MARGFAGESTLSDADLGLALAPALTPQGLVPVPSFFHGFATRPQVLARGLVTLADVTATRYFRPVPTNLRDPVLTAQGDRLRAECFSACNGVYARLDLLGAGFDGGEITYGTTNVDIGLSTRQALSKVARDQLLHLDVGLEGMTVSSMDGTAKERPVQMPDRWVRALGNAAEMHRGLVARLHFDVAAARQLVASLPAVTSKSRSGWLAPTRTGVQLSPRPLKDSVHIEGLHRLSAAKRLLTDIKGVWVHGPADGEPGPVLLTFELPDARLVLGLTPETWRGYSGEGSLLPALADPNVIDDADMVSMVLAFEPVIDVQHLVAATALPEDRVRSALAVLAASGRVGWDAHDEAYFHRELPDDPDRVDKDNPRLVAARKLAESGAARRASEESVWMVRSGDADYRVRLTADPTTPDLTRGATCTCTWYLRHGGDRGTCKHVLAVQLVTKASGTVTVEDTIAALESQFDTPPETPADYTHE